MRTIALALVVAILQVVPAAAYMSAGTDPQERTGSWVDILDSSRRVWRADDGVRYLRISLHFSSGSYHRITVRIDARGDGHADSIMTLYSGDEASGGTTGCSLAHGGTVYQGALGFGPRGLGCRVPVSLVHPAKQIRWRLIGRPYYSYGDPYDIPDYAPDVGWYF